MSTWIFQTNPNEFDMARFLGRRKNVWWSLKQKQYESKIKRLDEVFIWRSWGNQKRGEGIVAKAEITQIFKKNNDKQDSQEYWYMENWNDSNPRVRLYVLELRLKDAFIKKSELLEHPLLKNLNMFKIRNLTNYILTEEEAAEIKKLWDNLGTTQISFPPLEHSTRDREYKKYPVMIRDKIVYNYLFEGKTPRWMDENIIGVSSSYSRGWQSMGVLHYLGLVEAHKGIFEDITVKNATKFLSNYNDISYHKIASALNRYLQNQYGDDIQIFTPYEGSKKLIKKVGTSQYTDGVRIDKEFHDIFNPCNSPFYVERGKIRKIKILFNNKVFDAEYRFEDQEDKTIVLQSIRFRKELKEEFKKVFSNPEGEFSIQHGADLNHFVFTPCFSSSIIDEDENDYPEGKIAYRTHRIRERKPGVVKAAKIIFMKKNGGRLFCEACGFDFFKTYGERGQDFIEGHHKKLVSEMKEGEKTRAEDIAVLCSNCHRMIHKKPVMSVEDLSNLIKHNT